MRKWSLLLAISFATSCSKPTVPPAAGPPVTVAAGPFEAKLTAAPRIHEATGRSAYRSNRA